MVVYHSLVHVKTLTFFFNPRTKFEIFGPWVEKKKSMGMCEIEEKNIAYTDAVVLKLPVSMWRKRKNQKD